MNSNTQLLVGLLSLVVIFSLSGLLSGCDDDTIISPFSGREAYFSIYGFISTADTQYVRVIPIRNSVGRDTEPVDLGLTVRTTGMNTGNTAVWAPVLPLLENGERGVLFSDSTFGYVYRAIFTPVVNETYTMEVIRPDGKFSSASATVPRVQVPEVSDVWTRNDSLFQTVVFPGVEEPPFNIQIVYRVSSNLFYPEIQFPTAPLDYTGEGYQVENGWRVDIDLASDVVKVRQYIADNITQFSPLPVVEDVETYDLLSIDIRMRAEIGDSLWRQLDFRNTDTSRLSQPGAFSNVTNGFGYFGATGSNVRTWELPRDSTTSKIGFSM